MIPTAAAGQIAYVTVVRSGSREEWEPGKSGFAHFFEHIMFRGTKKYSNYDAVTTRIGAARNASTSSDVTQYYLVAAKESLEQIIDLESDRGCNADPRGGAWNGFVSGSTWLVRARHCTSLWSG